MGTCIQHFNTCKGKCNIIFVTKSQKLRGASCVGNMKSVTTCLPGLELACELPVPPQGLLTSQRNPNLRSGGAVSLRPIPPPKYQSWPARTSLGWRECVYLWVWHLWIMFKIFCADMSSIHNRTWIGPRWTAQSAHYCWIIKLVWKSGCSSFQWTIST